MRICNSSIPTWSWSSTWWSWWLSSPATRQSSSPSTLCSSQSGAGPRTTTLLSSVTTVPFHFWQIYQRNQDDNPSFIGNCHHLQQKCNCTQYWVTLTGWSYFSRIVIHYSLLFAPFLLCDLYNWLHRSATTENFLSKEILPRVNFQVHFIPGARLENWMAMNGMSTHRRDLVSTSGQLMRIRMIRIMRIIRMI